MSLSLIIEEGLPVGDLQRIVESVKETAEEAGVSVVTGDTKVVDRGSADRLFINTTGIGVIPDGIKISGAFARPGDSIIVSGTVGDHGVAIMSRREGLTFDAPVMSDCAPLNSLIAGILHVSSNIHCLRDPTRGGLATTLNEFARQSRVGIRLHEGTIPVNRTVLRACEMLGLDVLYVANEGKMVAVVAPEDAARVLEEMRRSPYGSEAAIIGEVVEQHPGRVVMETLLGASRIVDMPAGELLPRIC
jgi:hydrogenase expression/formation protein HypE